MHLLGIDYGRVYLGIAVCKDSLPYPLTVIKSKSDQHKIEGIITICKKEKIDEIIIGQGSNNLSKHIKQFSQKLQQKSKIRVFLIDETLTSNNAVEAMINQGISQKKRRKQEHAFAAVFLLEQYINN